MVRVFIVINVLLLTSAINNEKVCGPCPPVSKLYDELGCVGILDDNGCCFERFKCPDLNSLESSKCHLKGKTYEDREYAEANDLPNCQPLCRCDANPYFSSFNCPIFECASLWWRPTHSQCIKMYSIDHCCSTPTCDLTIITNRTICKYKGKTYHEGDKFFPEEPHCHSCVCDKNFDSSIPVTSNKNCKKIDCGLELRHFHELRRGCVPIYFERNTCCPHDFRCPNEKDEVIQLERSSDVPIIPEKMCKYGNHSLHIGESLNSDKPCVKCVCNQPPIIDCIKNYIC